MRRIRYGVARVSVYGYAKLETGVYVSKMQKYKSKALAAVQGRRDTVRTTVSVVEIGAGAFLGGYIAETMPQGLAGVPADAGIGLIALGVGVGMGQRDLSALGVGMLAGYLHGQGRTMAARTPSST